MDFAEPMDFAEAVQHLVAKNLLPTEMTSADLRQVSAGIRRQSIFSAQTTLTDYLQTIKETVQSVIQPKQETREGQAQTVTTGFNPATAREALRNKLADLGYQAKPDEKDTIKDLSSNARINLVVKTNVATAQGAGHYVQQNVDEDVVDLYPALELIRGEDVEVQRGEKKTKAGIEEDPENSWPTRFREAAEESGDDDALRVLNATGRMMALKASPLWQSLGDGAGGHEDGLGNPFPPFAFNSGMETEEVSRDEAEEVGLLKEGAPARPADFDFASLFKAA